MWDPGTHTEKEHEVKKAGYLNNVWTLVKNKVSKWFHSYGM